MEKRAEWAAQTRTEHFPISGRYPAIENGTVFFEQCNAKSPTLPTFTYSPLEAGGDGGRELAVRPPAAGGHSKQRVGRGGIQRSLGNHESGFYFRK